MLFLLADFSGDLTYRRTPESMIEASKGNAKFVALEVEWVATGETNVPEWLSEHRPEGQNDRSAIQGTWQVTYSEDSGRIAPQKMLENVRFVIDDQTLTTAIAGDRNT